MFLTNNCAIRRSRFAQLYTFRWQVGLLFTWITQQLRIDAVYRTSINAIQAQVWTAISVYHACTNSSWGQVGGLLCLHDTCRHIVSVNGHDHPGSNRRQRAS